MTAATTPLDQHDHDLSHLLQPEGFQQWRSAVTALGGCTTPIHLTGTSTIATRDGTVLTHREGDILAPCGNRRASVCPACSDRYASDAYHLIRAGMAGGKGVPDTAARHPRLFVTLTAPSFGPVHTRRVTARGLVIPCACGDKHRHRDDPRIGTALDPGTHDYTGAILWQAHAGKLWNRFAIRLRRILAGMLGVKVREFRDHARLSYAKVAEYQRRGLVHFHAVIRLDGPDGPTTAPPSWITTDALTLAVRDAARDVSLVVDRPDGTPLALAWGRQVDVRPITSTTTAALENDDGEITDAALAAYVAKYSTKGTGKSEATDRAIRDIAHLRYLDITDHHRRLIETAWELGGQEQYEDLNLRRWAHMLGFRGHFLTKSRNYSTTFGAIRGERRTYRLGQTLAGLDTPVDPDSVVVINDWQVTQFGHRNDAEREIALGIAERRREQRRARVAADHGRTT